MRWLLPLLLLVAACGDDIPYPFGNFVRVSGASPYELDCNGADDEGQGELRAAEVEPYVTAGDGYLLGAWQQDRWSNGGANGLGVAVSRDHGATWTPHFPKLSHCAGGDYERASDPWVAAAGADAYAIAIAFDVRLSARSAVIVSHSPDSGTTWGDPITLLVDQDPDIFSDKESIFADPTSGQVFAVWDRLTGVSAPMEPVGTGPAYLARGMGDSFEVAHAIYDPGVDAQTLGNVLASTPTSIVDVFTELTMASSDEPHAAIGAISSNDGGDTWSSRVFLTPGFEAFGVKDTMGVHVRGGEGLPSIAADGSRFYVVWEDARFGGDHDGVVISTSDDGGATWTEPAAVNQDLGLGAFTPVVAVAADGTVAVSYYTLDGDDAQLWLATSTDRGQTWTEAPTSGAFDITFARAGTAYFLGDYQGLTADGPDFVQFFAAPDRGYGQTDVLATTPE
jgi:hypothetical protein